MVGTWRLLFIAAVLAIATNWANGSQYPFVRGDANGDGAINLVDAVVILQSRFGGPPLVCEDTGDINDNGAVNIADAIHLLSYLFNSNNPPAAPFPVSGVDPTADSLACPGSSAPDLYDGVNGAADIHIVDILSHPGAELVSLANGPNQIKIHATQPGGCATTNGCAVTHTLNLAANPWDVEVGDVDGNGLLDLAATSRSGHRVHVYLQTAPNIFGSAIVITTPAPRGLVLMDVNSDGHLDVLTANETQDFIGVHLYDPLSMGFVAGTSVSAPSQPYDLVTNPDFDLNADGLQDALAVARGADAVLPLLGNGAGVSPGTIIDIAVPGCSNPRPWFIDLGDLDADGYIDFVVSNDLCASTLHVYRGAANGQFVFDQVIGTLSPPRHLVIEDVNQDGALDILVARPSSGTFLALINDVSQVGLSFTGCSFATMTGPRAIGVGDVDADGDVDVAVANFVSDTITVHRSQ
ncbi:MAG: FG-GAP-like repeat-containing protein [Planctomycetota bacterium]